MKTIQNELSFSLQLQMMMKKLAGWFKRNASPARTKKVSPRLTLKSLKTDALTRMIDPVKLQGTLNYPPPSKALMESIVEMNDAVKLMQKNDLLSEKKDRKTLYKMFKKRLNKLIGRDRNILSSGFNVKKDSRLKF